MFLSQNFLRHSDYGFIRFICPLFLIRPCRSVPITLTSHGASRRHRHRYDVWRQHRFCDVIPDSSRILVASHRPGRHAWCPTHASGSLAAIFYDILAECLGFLLILPSSQSVLRHASSRHTAAPPGLFTYGWRRWPSLPKPCIPSWLLRATLQKTAVYFVATMILAMPLFHRTKSGAYAMDSACAGVRRWGKRIPFSPSGSRIRLWIPPSGLFLRFM